MKSRGLRGFSLAAALLSFLVAFVVLATVATTSTFSLRMAIQSENAQTAQRLANSIVHQGVSAIVKDPSFHTDLNLVAGEARAPVSYTHLDVYKRQAIKPLLARGITLVSKNCSAMYNLSLIHI